MSIDTPAREQSDRLLRWWDSLVDPRVGIVREVTELAVDHDEPEFFHYLSTACDTSRFTPLRNFGNNGGVSTDRYAALAKAVGEGVERYCAAIFDCSELTFAPHRELGAVATPPEDYALYLPEQYRQPLFSYRPFTPDRSVAWTVGISLVTGETRLVPAAMVRVPYRHLTDGRDECIVQPISTGLACGTSFEDAAASGLCEVVERDAFTITWQAMVAWPRVRHDTLPPPLAALVRRFTDVRLDVEIIDITNDLRCPTMMAVALGAADSSPAVTVAAATHPSPAVALTKAVEELAHTRKFARQCQDYLVPVPSEVEQGHPQVRDQRHHLRFHCPQEAREFGRFAWSSPEWVDLADVEPCPGETGEKQLSALIDRIGARGHDVIAADLTTPDVAALGLSVVRVVVPGLHPLFMGHPNRARGGRRLYEVPQMFGHRGLRPGDPDNPYPHPFP